MVFPSSKYYEPLMAEVCWIKRSQEECSWRVPHSISWLCQSYLLCMGYPEETNWTWFDILIYASTTQKIICSFELSPPSRLLTLVYQLIVKSVRAFVIDAYYSCGPSSHSIAEWLGETNSSTSSISRIGSKKLCSADQIANPAFVLLYLGVLPSFISGLL